MMKELVFSGLPEQVGQQHGEALRAEIREVFGVYRDLWRLSSEQLDQVVLSFKVLTFKYFPSLDAEISGIAAGANLSDEQVYAINARTELLQGVSIPECSAVAVPPDKSYWDNVVLAQNWDWLNSLKGLARIVEINIPSKPRIKTLIEPGMVAKIGLNDAGLGVCVNFLETHDAGKKTGVPVHVLYRAVLESSTIEGARMTVFKVPHAASTHYLIGNNAGVFVSLEVTPSEVSCLSVNDVFTHTNSYSHHCEVCARQQSFVKVLGECLQAHNGRLSFDDINHALCSKGVCFPQSAICGSVETLAAIILNLKQKQMFVRGSGEQEFVMYGFR